MPDVIQHRLIPPRRDSWDAAQRGLRVLRQIFQPHFQDAIEIGPDVIELHATEQAVEQRARGAKRHAVERQGGRPGSRMMYTTRASGKSEKICARLCVSSGFLSPQRTRPFCAAFCFQDYLVGEHDVSAQQGSGTAALDRRWGQSQVRERVGLKVAL